MDKEKLITKVIFGSEDLSKVSFPVNEESKLNFEIAWDIWDNLTPICTKIKDRFFEKNLGRKIREIIQSEGFFVRDKIFNEVKYFGLVITKNSWIIGDDPMYVIKLNHDVYGNYELGLERWISKRIPEEVEKMEEKLSTFSRKHSFFNSVTKWWKFRDTFKSSRNNLRDWCLLLMSEDSIQESGILIKKFKELKDFLAEEIESNISVSQYIDEIVKFYREFLSKKDFLR